MLNRGLSGGGDTTVVSETYLLFASDKYSKTKLSSTNSKNKTNQVNETKQKQI